jgi:hypothetical protein
MYTQNADLICPKSVTLFAHNAGFQYSTVGCNLVTWTAVVFERLGHWLLLIMSISFSELAWKTPSYSAECGTYLQDIIFFPPTMLHAQLLSLVV